LSKPSVCVIGAGSWGTALAIVLARQECEVRLVARTPEKASDLERARENRTYLPGIRFPDSISVTAEVGKAYLGVDAIIIAIPCRALNDCLPKLAGSGETPVIVASKGLHPETMERTDEILARFLGMNRVVLLSGPSFALEVARGLPTALTMAAAEEVSASRVAGLFRHTNLRIYTNSDPAGVALGGALKNVIAIAAGISDGLGLGHNAIAALITRGLAEMTRLVRVCGGREATVMGLSGLGDLVLTCTGDLSRNRRLGYALAQGISLDAARRKIGQAVEGVRTAEAAFKLARKHGVEAPIISTVHHVILGEITPSGAVECLMQRSGKSES